MKLRARGGEIELDSGDEEGVITLTNGVLRSSSEIPLKMVASESRMELIAQNGDIALESSENVKVQARTGDIRMRSSNEVSISAVSDVTIETNTGDIRFSTQGVGKAVRIDADMYISRDLRVANRLTGSVLSDGKGGEIQNGTITAKTFQDESGARLENGNMRLSSLTDGVASLSQGSLLGCEHVGSKSVTSETFTDGVVVVSQGNIERAQTISTKSLTDGVASLSEGHLDLKTISSNGDASFGGHVKALSFSASGDGKFEGNLEVDGVLRTTKKITSESLSDGVSTLHQGKLSNLNELDSSVLILSSRDRYDREMRFDETSISVKNSDLTINLDEGRHLQLNSNLRLGHGFSIQDTSNLHRWPDYVFEKDYDLRSLDSLDEFVRKEKHLPGIPSRAEWSRRGGIDHSEMIRSLLLKVEELTLYTLELNERLRSLEHSS